MRSAAVWVLLGVSGCHTLFPHAPGEARPGDGPVVERRPQDLGVDVAPVDLLPVDARTGEPGADAPTLDLSGPDGPALDGAPPDTRHDVARDLPLADAQAPKPVLGVSCSAGCCSPAAWCWQNPLPQGNDLEAVWALSPTDVTMVGEHGTILHRFEGIYYQDTSSTKETLHAVWGTLQPERQLFAVGDQGTILRRDADSATWIPEAGATGVLNGVFGLSTGEVYAVGNTGAVFVRDPLTGKWAPATGWGIPNSVHLLAIWASGSTVYVGGFEIVTGQQRPRLWLKTPMGASAVEEIADNSLSATVSGIWGDGASIVAVGQNLIRQKVGNGPWSTLQSSGTYQRVFGAGGNYWITSSTGIRPLDLSATHANGVLKGIHGSGAGPFAVGYRGEIWEEGAGTWTSRTSRLATGMVTGIWGDSATGPWAVTDGGKILRFDGKWNVHNEYKPPLQGLLKYYGISGNGGTKIAVGESSNQSSPYNSASVVGTGSPSFLGDKWGVLNGVWVESGTKAHAVTGSGVLALAGTTWSTPAAATLGSELYGIIGFGAAPIVAVGKDATCLHAGSTGTWSCAPHGGSELRAVWGMDTMTMQKALYAVGNERIAGATLSAGATTVNWTTLSLPAGSGTLRAIWGRDLNLIYAAGDGGVIRAKQTALSWPTQESGTNKNLRGIYLPPAATAPCIAWAVGETGTILCKQP